MMDRTFANLIKKLDKAAKFSQKHCDAVSLCHEAFYEAFEKCLPDCCEECADPDICKLRELFWNYVIEHEMPDDIDTTEDLVNEMLRLMNEIEKKGE
jgi:hypothetical protein